MKMINKTKNVLITKMNKMSNLAIGSPEEDTEHIQPNNTNQYNKILNIYYFLINLNKEYETWNKSPKFLIFFSAFH